MMQSLDLRAHASGSRCGFGGFRVRLMAVVMARAYAENLIGVNGFQAENLRQRG
jgi:hypothetical protein